MGWEPVIRYRAAECPIGRYDTRKQNGRFRPECPFPGCSQKRNPFPRPLPVKPLREESQPTLGEGR